jgi:hypothetical protein
MKVELLQEWCGRPEGMVIDMVDSYARTMLDRGLVKQVEEKQVKEPPADKMLKDQSTKKK